MTINSLKELNKLMVLCRKRGIQSITVDGITFHMSDQTPEMGNPIRKQGILTANNTPLSPGGITEDTKISMPDELTEEQLMFYSARPESFEEQQ